MRLQLIVPLLVIALSGWLTETRARQALAGPFPDKNLEAAVRALVYDKKDDPSKELTDEDLTKIYLLEAKGKGIKDLTGLEKCVNLQLIDLAQNEITDVTPLKGLKALQSLTLANNKITDLGPIAGITALQYIEASNNQIRSLPPLDALTRLSALYIAGNQISDVTPVVKLTKLSSLDLAGNQITCVEALAELKGLSRRKVLLRHALPNALVPTLNITALNLAYLIGGVVVVEKVFSYPGFGSLLVDSLQLRDLPVFEATVVLAAFVYIVANLLADAAAILLNPRLRNG